MENRAVRRRRSAFAAFLATLVMALGFTAVPADAAPRRHVDYVALGDSYTAGTGAGEPVRPPGVDCWQSGRGYVEVVGKTGRVDLVKNAACHGAVLSPDSFFYDDDLYTPTVQEQIQALVASGALSSDTDLVSITAGANDLGFAYVLGVCAFSAVNVCDSAVDQATSPPSLEALRWALTQTYASIGAYAPNARIAVLGYPLLFDPVNPLAPILVENQVRMNDATVQVNATIEAAVESADYVRGVDAQYIDVTDEFAGHGAFSSDPWLQLSPTNFAADYNFHPNKEGHRAYASALLEAVKPAQLVR